jgi:two-component system sensor histidine kinase TctE
MSDGGILVVHVIDDGKGIPPRQRAAIFEPFTRLSGSESSSGTGLGLAIVREIAIAHGGTVSARDPDEGQGIVLEMRIPIAPTPPPVLEGPRLEAAS